MRRRTWTEGREEEGRREEKDIQHFVQASQVTVSKCRARNVEGIRGEGITAGKP